MSKKTKTEEISDPGHMNGKKNHNSQGLEQISFKGKENIVLTSRKENKLIAKLRKKERELFSIDNDGKGNKSM